MVKVAHSDSIRKLVLNNWFSTMGDFARKLTFGNVW